MIFWQLSFDKCTVLRISSQWFINSTPGLLGTAYLWITQGRSVFLACTKIILSLASLGLTSEFLLYDCCFVGLAGLIGLNLLRLKSEMDEGEFNQDYFGSIVCIIHIIKDLVSKGKITDGWFWKKIELLPEPIGSPLY